MLPSKGKCSCFNKKKIPIVGAVLITLRCSKINFCLWKLKFLLQIYLSAIINCGAFSVVPSMIYGNFKNMLFLNIFYKNKGLWHAFIFLIDYLVKNAFVYISSNFVHVTLTSVPWIIHYTFSVAPSVANDNIPATLLVLYHKVLLTDITHWVFLETLHIWNIMVCLWKR
jgi:hypothetical protein